MTTRASFIFAAALASATAAFAQTTGPSSSATPYIQTTAPGWSATSVLTVGDSVGGYKMVGIPDGLGAYDNNNGTFTLLMNHELGETVGSTRAHGAKGAFVSEWVINKSNLSVVSGGDLITKVYDWNTTDQKSNLAPSTIAFNRFCSSDLASTSAFYNASTGLGTQTRILLNGEEGGANGRAVATIATGADKGSSYVLGKFNLATNGSGSSYVGAWENLLANPLSQNKTVIIGNNDGGTGIMNNSIGVYVGTKTNIGTDADKAGLTNGTIKFVKVDGNTAEITNTTTRATGITSGTAFTLSATASTTFSRPEDGVWDVNNANKFYFVTTDRLDQVADGVGTQVGRSRLWSLNFSDITNPDAGGTISKLLEGTEGQNMFDNMTISMDGLSLILQEDVGGAAHNGKVWNYDIATGLLTQIAKHDASRFGDVVGGVVTAATGSFTNDEETSGVIDVTDIIGGTGKTYLLVDQAHYPIADELVEGGQLVALKYDVSAIPEPSTYAAIAGAIGLGMAAYRRRRSA